MEPAVFLGGPKQARTVSIISWNLNGVKTKIEKDNVKELLYRYVVISVNEVKIPLSISLPRYVTYRSAVRGSSERGVIYQESCFETYLECGHKYRGSDLDSVAWYSRLSLWFLLYTTV